MTERSLSRYFWFCSSRAALRLSAELIALAEHGAGIRSRDELRGVTHADIGACARLDAVIAGELVDIEQDRVVEHEAQRVFVRDVLLIADRVGPVDADDDEVDRPTARVRQNDRFGAALPDGRVD